MKKIPIKQAEGFAIANGLKQVIIFGYDGTNTHIVTWGDTVENSAQAAAGANHVKKLWAWPEDTIVESAKVQALRDELAATQRDLAAVMEELRNLKNDVPMKPPLDFFNRTPKVDQ